MPVLIKTHSTRVRLLNNVHGVNKDTWTLQISSRVRKFTFYLWLTFFYWSCAMQSAAQGCEKTFLLVQLEYKGNKF